MGERLIAGGMVAAALTALWGAGCVIAPEVESQPGSTDIGIESQALKQCGDHPKCRDDQFCARELGACSVSGKGTCQTMPEECSYLDDPVCGCDGVTYSNACFAAMMGASVKFRGKCETE